MGTLCCAPFVCFGTIFQDYVGSYETRATPANLLEGSPRKSFMDREERIPTKGEARNTIDIVEDLFWKGCRL